MKNGFIYLAFLSLSSVAFSAENLSWNDNSDNESGFKIERSIDGGEFIEIGETGPDVAEFIDQDPPLGADLSYRVYAWNEYGNSGYSNTASTSTKPPSQPDGLKLAKLIAKAATSLLLVGLFVLGIRGTR